MPRKKLARVQSPMIDIPAAPSSTTVESLRAPASRPPASELAAPAIASDLQDHPAA